MFTTPLHFFSSIERKLGSSTSRPSRGLLHHLEIIARTGKELHWPITVRHKLVKLCRTVCSPKFELYAKVESKGGVGREEKQGKKNCGGFGLAIGKSFAALFYPGCRRRRQENVSKGHLAVYVGENGGQTFRFVVPIGHFNHLLFRQLLKEAEEEYGFCQQGGVTIPCHLSRFESVTQRIAADKFSGEQRSGKSGTLGDSWATNHSVQDAVVSIRRLCAEVPHY